MSDVPVIRRAAAPDAPVEWDGDEPTLAPTVRPPARSEARQLDEIVDRVVARIEQRVIDELERRGRRGIPGAF